MRETRGCSCGLQGHDQYTHFWQRMVARALNIQITYYHGDDKSETKREYEFEIPYWAYRPICWLRRKHEPWTENYRSFYCITCHKPLPKPR